MKHCFFIFLLVCNINFLYSEVEFRLASEADIPGILKLMNNEIACKDIYPQKRRKAIESEDLRKDINDKKVFVAVNNTTFCCCPVCEIIGFKKLYVQNNQASDLVICIESECFNQKYDIYVINTGLFDTILNSLNIDKENTSTMTFNFKDACKDTKGSQESIDSFIISLNSYRSEKNKWNKKLKNGKPQLTNVTYISHNVPT